MRGSNILAVALVVGAAVACARGEVVYVGQHFDVGYTDVEQFTAANGPMVRFTLQVLGKDGFQPSSFDGIMRHGVLGGATGITGDGMRHGLNGSRFLDDPADMLWIDAALLNDYTPDPEALTGLFALVDPSAIAPVWNLAEIVIHPAVNVRLDFTIGQVGSNVTESLDSTFVAPGELPMMPGDFDGDGDVDLDDFVILKCHFGMTGAPRCDGDGDGDGDVDLDDFVILKNNFGAVCFSSPCAGALPEPASAALLAAGWALAVRRRRR